MTCCAELVSVLWVFSICPPTPPPVPRLLPLSNRLPSRATSTYHTISLMMVIEKCALHMRCYCYYYYSLVKQPVTKWAQNPMVTPLFTGHRALEWTKWRSSEIK